MAQTEQDKRAQQVSGLSESGYPKILAVDDEGKLLGYEFTINGINFSGYGGIKMLTLDADARDSVPISLHDAGVDYVVPAGKVFKAYGALIYNQINSLIGRIGEGDVKDGDGAGITREVLRFANGTNLPFMVACIGTFAAGKFITAETDSSSSSYNMKAGSVLYGVEMDA